MPIDFRLVLCIRYWIKNGYVRACQHVTTKIDHPRNLGNIYTIKKVLFETKSD